MVNDENKDRTDSVFHLLLSLTTVYHDEGALHVIDLWIQCVFIMFYSFLYVVAGIHCYSMFHHHGKDNQELTTITQIS